MIQSLNYEVVGVEKIHCDGCERRITGALKRLDGVRNVSASAADQRVAVAIEKGRVEPEQIEQRLAQLGYEVRQY
jgi:copper chaperone CopZ